jgi:hypothetical protein
MLKTGQKLELLTDYDMHLFVERGLRGGISMVSRRYAKANNKYVSGFDSSKKSKYIHYLDANNLYGWAMIQALPTGGFQWTDKTVDEIMETPDDADIGYMLEVDLEYPKELHDSHDAYPLAPERLVVDEKWLSNYQNSLSSKTCNISKLVPNLMDKKNYILHYRNLKLYIELGMKITKNHKVLQFNQSAWMKTYIEMNTQLRKNAKNSFEKDLYKLMNNSVFGKTMENLRKRVDVKLVRGSEENKLRKLIASPAFAKAKIFDMDLAAVHMHKSKLMLNKPVFVGMSILDLSKLFMYDFYYNTLKKEYGDKCDLLYTDTDSLLLEIETDDIFDDMSENAQMYDFSDYPKTHRLYSEINKKIVGKFKDECAGVLNAEYVGLRPKMYSIRKSDLTEIKKAKGVKRIVVKNDLTHDSYLKCLQKKKTYINGQDMMRSKDHQMVVLHQNKVSLSAFDNKKFILDDGISTLAYGNYAIT